MQAGWTSGHNIVSRPTSPSPDGVEACRKVVIQCTGIFGKKCRWRDCVDPLPGANKCNICGAREGAVRLLPAYQLRMLVGILATTRSAEWPRGNGTNVKGGTNDEEFHRYTSRIRPCHSFPTWRTSPVKACSADPAELHGPAPQGTFPPACITCIFPGLPKRHLGAAGNGPQSRSVQEHDAEKTILDAITTCCFARKEPIESIYIYLLTYPPVL